MLRDAGCAELPIINREETLFVVCAENGGPGRTRTSDLTLIRRAL